MIVYANVPFLVRNRQTMPREVCYNETKKRKGCCLYMPIDPMTKMNISLLAIALMFVCNFMVMFARKTENGLLRFLLKTVAFFMLLAIFVMIVIVVFV
jgi:hypothetical protein